MNKTRTTPILPLFSSMAILSFKKKSKGSDLGGLSTSMDDLSLDGENLSLSDLGGSVGSLSKLEKKDKDGGLDEKLLAGITSGPRAEDKKFMEIEASVNDLKKHAETADMNSKATKGEIDSMKKDLSQINENIKSLLNVYEAVSRQYNPFVECDTPAAVPVIEGSAKEEEADLPLDSLSSLGTLGGLDEKKLADLKAEAPKDHLGSLDRLVKPDDVEEDDLDLDSLSELGTMAEKRPEAPMVKEEKPKYVPEPIAVPQPMPQPKGRPSATVDVYAMEQVHKLVEHQMSKIYRVALTGAEPDRDELETLDRWMNEFKRLGGG
jgi:hypothetical protein